MRTPSWSLTLSLPANFAEELAATRGDPSAFSKLIFGTPMHRGQTRYATNATATVNFLTPGNSWGKTEFLLRFAVYNCWWKLCHFDPPQSYEEWEEIEYKGLICSYSYSVAKESFDRFLLHHNNRDTLQAIVSDYSKSDPPRITFTNGSILDWGSLADDGRHIEAARRRFIAVDEAGQIPDFKAAYDNVLYPRTMGVGGVIHLIGTPKPHTDPFLLEVHERGLDGDDPFYYSQKGHFLENEFWPQQEVERVIKNNRYISGWKPCSDGDNCQEELCIEGHGHPIMTDMGRQVLLGDFLSTGQLFFNKHHIAAMFEEHTSGEWLGDDSYSEPPLPGHIYIGGFDLGGNRLRKSRKQGSDATVGVVLDITNKPWRLVRYEYVPGGTADWHAKYQLMQDFFESYPMPFLLIDTTGTVDSVQEELEKRGLDIEGVHFGGNSSKKFDMLRGLQLAVDMQYNGTRGLLRSPLIPRMKKELTKYALPDDRIEQDTVMVMAMVVSCAVDFDVPESTVGEVW